MRLIDAGALINEFNKFEPNEEDREEFIVWMDCYMEVYKAPTVEIMKQGKWNEAEAGDGIVCSVCGTDYCNMIKGIYPENFKYCPNCGAKMDGE